MARKFSGPVTFEGQMTGDDRFIESEALNWVTPLPLNLTHDGMSAPVQVGVFTKLDRLEDGTIWGEGVFLDTPEGLKAAEDCAAVMAAGAVGYGVSVDLDDASLELRVRRNLLGLGGDEDEAPEDGDDVDDENEDPDTDDTDDDERVTVATYNSGDFVTAFTAARIRAASLVAIPAFRGAYVGVLEDAPVDDEEIPAEEEAMSLVASAFPVAPPAEWFENPEFSAETPITIDDDGRFYGHAATWGTFHIGFAGQRIEAPRSIADYAYFRTGVIRTAEGTDIPIGVVTMETGHASEGLSASSTLAHYDNTGTAVADVVVGEDDFGIWVAGAVRPGVTDEQVRALRAAPLSGDWREIRGNLELVALLAVNTPGFPVPRMAALVAGGVARSLVASAMFGVEPQDEDAVEFTREEKLALREMLAERNPMPTPKDIFGAQANQADTEEHTADPAEPSLDHLERLARAEAAKKRFRAEQARLRALRAVKES